MKRFRFAAALFAILALGAMAAASSASAVTFLLAEWLENGVGTTETMLVETSGSLELMDNNAPVTGGLTTVLCEGILDGFIGPNGADEITEILTTGGGAISTIELSGSGLSCTAVAGTCGSPKVWAVNLPWLTLAELWEESTEHGFVDLIEPHTGGGNPGWYVECTILGIKGSDTCTTPQGASSLSNEGEGVLGVFSEPFTELMGLKLATCSRGEETGQVEGAGGITLNSLGGKLEISSE